MARKAYLSNMVGGEGIWTSPNGKWTINAPSDGSMFWNGYRRGNRVLEVGVSDGWSCYYVEVYSEYGNRRGVIVEDEMFEYRVPKYVRDKTYDILKRAYKRYENGLDGRKLYR